MRVSQSASDARVYSDARQDVQLRGELELRSMRETHPGFEGLCRHLAAGFEELDEHAYYVITEGVIAALVARGWRPGDAS